MSLHVRLYNVMGRAGEVRKVAEEQGRDLSPDERADVIRWTVLRRACAPALVGLVMAYENRNKETAAAALADLERCLEEVGA